MSISADAHRAAGSHEIIFYLNFVRLFMMFSSMTQRWHGYRKILSVECRRRRQFISVQRTSMIFVAFVAFSSFPLNERYFEKK